MKLGEQDLAEVVVQYLSDNGWDVYQEVELCSHGIRADIVAICNGKVWVIECKTSLSMDLIGQCYNWLHYAHLVSAACPYARHRFSEIILDHFGIGLLHVNFKYNKTCSEVLAPKIYRVPRGIATKILLNGLHPEHKTFARAGTQGGYFSKFSRTKQQLIGYIKMNPGCLMRDAIKILGKMHYASPTSAKVSLSKWIYEGYIKEIEFRDGKLYLVEEKCYEPKS
jgi:hypothetical protein